jgi:beta-galactosidase
MSSPSIVRALWSRLALPIAGVLSALVWTGCDLTAVEQADSVVGAASRETFPFGNIWGSGDGGADAASPYGNASSVDAPDNVAGTQRVDVIINPQWKFLRRDDKEVNAAGVPLVATADFVESDEWTVLDLPHTWNWTDGQNGPATTAKDQNYYRGPAWYRKHYTIPAATMSDKKLFLQFDAASYITDCWVNGKKVGSHKGGYAGFRFDITDAAKVGQDNVIAVRVENSPGVVVGGAYEIIQSSPNAIVPPLNGDFTMFGGIYRDLHIIALPALSLSPFHYGSPGVYLRPVKKDATTWTVNALIKLVNSSSDQKTASVDLVLLDPNGNVVGTYPGSTTVPGRGGSADGGVELGGQVPGDGVAPPREYGSADLAITATVQNPMLWDGLGKGNVYRAYVVVKDGSQATDAGSPQSDAGADAAADDAAADVSVAPDAAVDASAAPDATNTGAAFDVGTGATDAIKVPLGFRTFSWDFDKGWSLNDRLYPLRGVCMHQDHWLRGGTYSSIVPATSAAIDNDFTILNDLGPNFIRFAHYQHSQYTYSKADELGYVAWAENAWVDKANNDARGLFRDNVSQQMQELVYQNFNHPSVLMWSCGNEIFLKPGPEPFDTMLQCVQHGKLAENLGKPLADEINPPAENRPIVYAQNAWEQERPAVWQPQIVAFNEYQGWYYTYADKFAAWADEIHTCAEDIAGARANMPKANGKMCWEPLKGRTIPNPPKKFPVGLSEYGAGANPVNHQLPILLYPGDRTGGYQTEEYQAYYHEQYYLAIYERQFLVMTAVWAMFDFSSDNRDEGNLPGQNTKGLVTFDRSVKKDSYYFYKTNWSADPLVHITSKRFDKLPQNSTTVKVYSNLPTVELFVNGTLFKTLTQPEANPPLPKYADPKHPRNHIFTFKGVQWVGGFNVVKAVARSADNQTIVEDSVGEAAGGSGPDAGTPEFTWFF